MNIGDRIKSIRLTHGYSQNMLADLAGISQTHLRRVELGQADITVGHLQFICDVFGMTLSEFFYEHSEEKIDPRSLELIFKYNKLNERERTLVTELIDVFSQTASR